MLYTLVVKMVLKIEQRNFGEAGPLEVLQLNLGPSGVHIELLLKLRKKVKKILLSSSTLSCTGTGFAGWIDPRFNSNHHRNCLNLSEILSETLSGKMKAFLHYFILNFPGFTLAKGS